MMRTYDASVSAISWRALGLESRRPPIPEAPALKSLSSTTTISCIHTISGATIKLHLLLEEVRVFCPGPLLLDSRLLSRIIFK